MAAQTETLDGRTSRSQRTRGAIVDALIDLVLAGDHEPTAQQIADRAGVSVRSVYGHFRRLGDLHQAAIDKAAQLVLQRVEPIDPDEGLDTRIDLLCGQRARINEDLGPLLQAAAHGRHTSAELEESRQTSRQASTAQIERVFAAELAHHSPGARTRRVATIDGLLSLGAWTSLRRDHHLSPDQARLATNEALRGLLAPPGPAGDAPG